MSSQVMNKKKRTTEKKSLDLSYDLLVSCLARVSRLYHPTLSLVSKSFRSLIASPEFNQTRSSLGQTDTCLYVCLQFTPDSNPRWYTLCPKPEKTLSKHITKKKKKKKKKEKESSSGYVLAEIPIPNSPSSNRSAVVSVGSNIYNIGGYIGWRPLSSVWILDCKTHTWHEGPSMRGKRMFPSGGVIDGKIYVGGGCEDRSSSAFKAIEVFDPKTQTWDLMPCPNSDGLNWSSISRSACIEGIFCLMLGHQVFCYEPEEGKWVDVPEFVFGKKWNRSSECVIENVLYSYDQGAILWYNSKVKEWEEMKGLEELPKFASNSSVKLANYGGKMAVLWDKVAPSSGYKSKTIQCAVITLEKPNGIEIRGKVEWYDSVLTVPKSYVLLHALSTTF